MIEGIAGIFCCLRRKNPSKSDAKRPSTELRHYKFYELEKATDSFSEERLIGSGAFGNVYKGVFDGEKRTLAIKRAHSGSVQTLEEFRNEVELLSRVRHRNLVRLVGYCTEAEQKVLVYEYVSQGCLLEYIVGKGREPLTWQQRVNIAIGTAKGIAHLHEVQPCIIHRDVKPSNILIDDEFEPKVSDFGLVKLGPAGDASHVSTQVKGTPGYMDPAYCSSLHLTTASDVFSFGVILLQLVTASPALDHMRHKSAYHISDWARYSVECGMVEAILDGTLLLEECNTKMMLKMAQLGLRCTAWQPKDRPTMSQVAKELEEAMQQAQRSVRRPASSDESQSVSIDGVGLQRFYVEGCDDLSFSSTNFMCLDANGRSSGDCKNKLSGIFEEHL